MSGPRAACLWGASLVGLAAASVLGEGARPSATGSALLLALAVATAPGSEPIGDADEARDGLPWWAAVAACLPVLAAAFALDRARGVEARAALGLVGWGTALLILWTLAVPRARGWRRTALTVVALGPPTLALALDWAGAGAGTTTRSWVEELARTSPLGWTWLAMELPSAATAPPFGALALAALFGWKRPPAVRARAATTAVALVGLGFLAAPAAEAGESRLFRAALEVEGPCERVAVTVDDGHRATVELALAVGERRTLEVLLPASSRLARDLGAEPRLAVEGGGSARFGGWIDASDPLGGVPPGLVARARPAPERSRARLRSAALATLAAAGLVGVLAGRRRPWLTALIGVGLAVPLALGAGVQPARSEPVRLLDLELVGDRWSGVEALAASHALELPLGEWRLETVPDGAALEVAIDARAGVGARPRVLSRGAVLLIRRALDPGDLALRLTGDRSSDPREAALAALEAEGLGAAGRAQRVDDGGWAAPRPLPSWLVTALPFGRAASVLVPAGVEEGVSSRGPAATWVRVLGP